MEVNNFKRTVYQEGFITSEGSWITEHDSSANNQRPNSYGQCYRKWGTNTSQAGQHSKLGYN